jgi:hypothetical protein
MPTEREYKARSKAKQEKYIITQIKGMGMKYLLFIVLLLAVIITAGCTLPNEQKVTEVKVTDNQVTDVQVVFLTTIDPTSPTFGFDNQSPEVLIGPYLLNSKGEQIVGGIINWPDRIYNITVEYEIWSLNCTWDMCEKIKYDENKGTMIYRGKGIVNQSIPAIRLDFVDLIPQDEKIISTFSTNGKMYAVTQNQKNILIIDTTRYVIFAKIITPESKIYNTVSKGTWFFPPIDRFTLTQHHWCSQNSDCKKDWICHYNTCSYSLQLL